MRKIETLRNLLERHTHINTQIKLMDVESAPDLFDGTLTLDNKDFLLECYGEAPVIDFWYSQNKVWIIIDYKETNLCYM